METARRIRNVTNEVDTYLSPLRNQADGWSFTALRPGGPGHRVTRAGVSPPPVPRGMETETELPRSAETALHHTAPMDEYKASPRPCIAEAMESGFENKSFRATLPVPTFLT